MSCSSAVAEGLLGWKTTIGVRFLKHRELLIVGDWGQGHGLMGPLQTVHCVRRNKWME